MKGFSRHLPKTHRKPASSVFPSITCLPPLPFQPPQEGLIPQRDCSGMVNVLHIVKGNVGSLGNRFAGCNTNGDVFQVFVRVWKGCKFQRLVLSSLRSVGEADSGNLLVVDVEACNREGPTLSKAFSGASIGAEAKVETLEVERCYAWASHELSVGVQGEGAKLEKVNWAGGASLVWR